ncbi:MAG TPA: DUF3634 family protein [Gemmatales bacterium]|nr:DUF3634 family protein [Gemmatales bacterium]HMP15767.1 DUF3634 family protein [Gemmatales bacterium]
MLRCSWLVWAFCFIVWWDVPIMAQQGHLWTWKTSLDTAKLRKCISEMKLLLEASPIPLTGLDGKGSPNITDTIVAFSTAGSEAGFVFPGNLGVNTCKSIDQEHDAVVTACLLVVLDHFSREEVTISSDKSMDTEWKAGSELYSKVLGREPRNKQTNAITGLTDLVSKINLKPSWDISRLWIVFALAAIGALFAWFILNPRPDFTIHFEKEGNAYVKGAFPEAYAGAVRTFFKSELPMKRNAMVKGWNQSDGRFRLGFLGPISDREQQRIRNFFAMLRKK